jgi:hypothetical protein
MRIKTTILGLFCLLTVKAFPQNDALLEPTLLRKKYFVGGGAISSTGWSTGVRYGFHDKGAANASEVMLDFARVKHEKEVRIVNPAFENSKPYVFGQTNMTFALRLGAGRKKVLSKRLFQRAVVVNWNYYGGFSGMLLKPIFLEIYYRDNDQISGFFNVEKYDPVKHTDQSRIFGRTNFFTGLDQMKIRPGGFAKTAFTFEWGDVDEDIKAIEAGAVLDIYPEEIPILAFSKNQPYFLTVYLGFNWGSRW